MIQAKSRVKKKIVIPAQSIAMLESRVRIKYQTSLREPNNISELDELVEATKNQ